MAEDEKPDVEPTDEELQTPLPSTKGRQSFRRVRRELTEEELNSPAAKRMLLDELDRLDREISELKSFQDKYYIADKQAGILDEKLKRHNSLDILSSGALIAGSLALGYAPTVWNSSAAGLMLLALGGILVIAGIWAKAVRA